jgi:hypothetical protein
VDRTHSGGLRAIFVLEGAKEEDGPQMTGHRSLDDRGNFGANWSILRGSGAPWSNICHSLLRYFPKVFLNPFVNFRDVCPFGFDKCLLNSITRVFESFRHRTRPPTPPRSSQSSDALLTHVAAFHR